MEHFDLLLRGGTVVGPERIAEADVGIRDGKIAAVGALGAAAAATVFEARGLHVLPGVIDSQVHFREPGAEHKEDIESGTRAAALGGVTAVFEMPNTRPPTVSEAALTDKLSRARGRAHVDHAFYIGADGKNTAELARLERLPGCCGIKVFMGSSTGSLLVEDDATLAKILASGGRRVAVHAEDEARLRARRPLAEGDGPERHPLWRDVETAVQATNRLLKLAHTAGRRVHVLHVSTAEELALLKAARDIASVEVTPQHLTLAAPDCYREFGSLAQMNPPIREARHRDALWRAVADGTADVIGSDHAPHTRQEKAKPYPGSPSGMPGVQTLLPLMLDHLHQGRLDLRRLVDLTSAGPARVFGIEGKGCVAPGFDGDLTLVDLGRRQIIEASWLASRCGWSPFIGRRVTGWPVASILRGMVLMRDGALVSASRGEPIRFHLD